MMHPYTGKKFVVNCEAALQYSSNRTDGYSSREKINLINSLDGFANGNQAFIDFFPLQQLL